MNDNPLQQTLWQQQETREISQLAWVRRWAESDPPVHQVQHRLQKWLHRDLAHEGHTGTDVDAFTQAQSIRKPMIAITHVPCADQITPWVLEHVPRYAGGLARNTHLSPESIQHLQDWARGEISKLRAQQEATFGARRRMEQVGRVLEGLSERDQLDGAWVEELLTYIAPEGGKMVEGPFTKQDGQKRWTIYQNVIENLKLDPLLLFEAWKRVENPDKAAAILFKHDQMTHELLVRAIQEGLGVQPARQLSRIRRLLQNTRTRQALRTYQDGPIHQKLVGAAQPGTETNELLGELAQLSPPHLARTIRRINDKQRAQLDRATIEVLLQAPDERVREIAIRATSLPLDPPAQTR